MFIAQNYNFERKKEKTINYSYKKKHVSNIQKKKHLHVFIEIVRNYLF